MSHAAASFLCRAIKLQCELYPSRVVALCLDPYSGLGFALWCLSRLTNAPILFYFIFFVVTFMLGSCCLVTLKKGEQGSIIQYVQQLKEGFCELRQSCSLLT